jgi:hypothetical protein
MVKAMGLIPSMKEREGKEEGRKGGREGGKKEGGNERDQRLLENKDII